MQTSLWATWTSRPFFSDRPLMDRYLSNEKKKKKIEDKSWGKEVLNKLYFVSSKFIKKYSILHTICRGK